MSTYPLKIREIKRKVTILEDEHFVAALNGTHYKVFLSNAHVIRFRDNDQKLLLRETGFLKKLNHPLIPKILWSGKVNQSAFMIENRLPGRTINLVWKNLSPKHKKNIIKQVITFIKYQRSQTCTSMYSVKTGKRYKRFLDYLLDGITQKMAVIRKLKSAEGVLEDLLLIINDRELRRLLTGKTKISLVHGDLIIHNLLTDGKNLTGVIDWELALWGDIDYDICRLFYYRECARAYETQGLDESFEADYMNKLITAMKKSSIIKNIKMFQKKYIFVRAIYFLNALYWAANSTGPKKNIEELTVQWNKKARLNI